MSIKLKNLLKIAFVSQFINSCQTVGYFQNYEVVGLSKESKNYLSTEIVTGLTKLFPPSRTKFVLSKGEGFSKELEFKLRAYGYLISQNAKDGIKLSYKIDKIGKEYIYVKLAAGKKYQLSRVYTYSKEGILRPKTPITMLF